MSRPNARAEAEAEAITEKPAMAAAQEAKLLAATMTPIGASRSPAVTRLTRSASVFGRMRYVRAQALDDGTEVDFALGFGIMWPRLSI
jgi:hypothetical protein